MQCRPARPPIWEAGLWLKPPSSGAAGLRPGMACCWAAGGGAAALVLGCALTVGRMAPVAAVEFMGAAGLLAIAWENCGLDIFRWACCIWKLEAAGKGPTVLLAGLWLLRLGIP